MNKNTSCNWFVKKLKKNVKSKLKNEREKSDQTELIYMRMICFQLDFISKNDLKIRFMQIDLEPKEVFIDAIRKIVVVIFDDENCSQKFAECLAVNSNLFELVSNFALLDQIEVEFFVSEVDKQKKRSSALKSLRKTHRIKKIKIEKK